MKEFAVVLLVCVSACFAGDHEAALRALRGVDQGGAGHAEGQAALKTLARAKAADVPAILSAMNGSNPIAANWLRSVAEAAATRGNDFPTADIRAFLLNRSNDPQSRLLAFDLLQDRDSTIRSTLLPTMLDDPSAQLRFDAVGLLVTQAEGADDAAEKQQLFLRALDAAREPSQINQIATALEALDQHVDLVEHFGFITSWYLVGPFDNTEMSGFDTTYPPEETVDLAASYDGKEEEVRWQFHSTEDAEGSVDVNGALGKDKGSIAYCATTFVSDRDQTVEVRFGSENAHKIWVNGQLCISNEVYHAGMSIDQYRGGVALREGANDILIKLCQNEQTQPWAQDWKFQLRITDVSGKAIRPAAESETASKGAN